MADFPIAYAVYNKNEQIRVASTSGGIFSCIASYLINQKKQLSLEPLMMKIFILDILLWTMLKIWQNCEALNTHRAT